MNTRGQKVKETRYLNIRAEQSAESKDLILTGRAIVFNKSTVIYDPFLGEYNEIILSGALDNADLTDVRLLYNHDTNKVPLARTPKTLELTVDNEGLNFKAILPNTETAKEVHTAVLRGDLTGCSFAFTIPDGGDTYDPETNTRTIHKINKVYECSVVVFPAYQETSVEARSKQQELKNKHLAKKSALELIKTIIGA